MGVTPSEGGPNILKPPNGMKEIIDRKRLRKWCRMTRKEDMLLRGRGIIDSFRAHLPQWVGRYRQVNGDT